MRKKHSHSLTSGSVDFEVDLRLVQVFYLSDPYSCHPQVQAGDVVTAQVLDVLRVLLDLRMLDRQVDTLFSIIFVFVSGFKPDIYIYIILVCSILTHNH